MDSTKGHSFNYYPTVYNGIRSLYTRSNCLFFALSWVTELLPSQYFWLLTGTIPWPGFHASLLKKQRRLSTCTITMHVQRRRCATNVKMSHPLATLYSNKFVVYGQNHKVWVLVFLERAEHFKTKIEQIWGNLLFCNKTASSVQQLHHSQ